MPIAVATAWAAIAFAAVDMKSAKKLAFAGIFTALAFIFMFLGSVFQTLDLSASALASLVVLIAFIELGKGWAFGIYAASSVLGIFLLPNKTAALVFACFVGFYPIVKAWLNAIRPKWLSYVARISLFNLILTLLVLAASKLLGPGWFGGPSALLYPICNVTFIVYDLALEKLPAFYSQRLKKLFFGRR
ncbi:MAG: hypothetical protein IJO64_05660 [Clostridia bacterium]|nr:hypothetical protein [Clostridia bacterium]